MAIDFIALDNNPANFPWNSILHGTNPWAADIDTKVSWKDLKSSQTPFILLFNCDYGESKFEAVVIPWETFKIF